MCGPRNVLFMGAEAGAEVGAEAGAEASIWSSWSEIQNVVRTDLIFQKNVNSLGVNLPFAEFLARFFGIVVGTGLEATF